MIRVEKEGQTLLQGQATCSLESKSGAVVDHCLVSHQCGSGSNPGVDSMGNLDFLSPQKLTFPISISIRNQIDEESLCDALPLNHY